ncbi:MAG: hypothetical protein ABI378_06215 [Chitinophagaceae bacterium]
MDPLIILLVLFGIIYIIYKKVRSEAIKDIIKYSSIILLIMFTVFPLQMFGRWRAIKFAKNSPPIGIILIPSLPNYDVNLVDSIRVINNTNQVDSIRNYLYDCELAILSHPERIWKVKMLLVHKNIDTIKIEVHRTENNGVIIYSQRGQFRNDDLGIYLEKITKYSKAVFGKINRNS